MRPFHDRTHPAHVTLRAAAGLPSLRTACVFSPVREALRLGQRDAFRICHLSVQGNHIHMLVEATNRQALSRGVQGLAIRLARAINRACRRRGRVWADRYHRRDLATPREVRNALVYVLNNWRKHGHGAVARAIDWCSSAPWFAGWKPRPPAMPPGRVEVAIVAAETWLLRAGWLRHGAIAPDERPRSDWPYGAAERGRRQSKKLPGSVADSNRGTLGKRSGSPAN